MKTFLTRFFVTLGVVFFTLMCAGAYVWFADPFEIRPFASLLFGGTSPVAQDRVSVDVEPGHTEATGEPAQERVVESPSSVDEHPALSDAQEAALRAVGIEPSSIPTSISPEQEACFTEKLGAARVAEIKGGAAPSPVELFTARSCLE